jgi:DNA-binding CsgD family transcriptional regulator
MQQPAPLREPGGPGATAVLNRRDVEVLVCLAEGKSTSQIAAILSVTGNTARTRIRRIQGKLDVSSRSAVVRTARELGYLRIPSPRHPIG